MRKTYVYIVLLICNYGVSTHAKEHIFKPEQHFFVFGGDINHKFVNYVVELTDKPNPKICYLPTASGDNDIER